MRLLRGIYVTWLSIVGAVVACTLVGLSWNFQRSTNGLPTSVLQLRNVITPSPAVTGSSVVPTAFPTSTSEPTGLPNIAKPGSEATLAPNQDTSFGYGIQTRLNINTLATLDQLHDLGMTWVKYPVSWAQIEPEAGQYQWADLDTVLSAASGRGLNVLLTVSDAPGWARSVTAKGKNGAPDNVQTYVHIMTLILQRYGNAISAIEIWNDENIDQSWYSPGGLSPASYLNLLIPTAQAIRQAAPGVIIVSGALTPTGRNDGISAIDDFVYMQGLINGKILDYVDCVGVHHDGFNLPPTLSAEDAFSGGMPPGTLFAGPYDASNPVNPHHSWSFFSTLNGYHNMVVAAGYETPLCVTEFGWASAEGLTLPSPDFLFARDNTQDEQAKYIVRAYRAMHDWGFVRLAVLYNLDYAAKPVDSTPDSAALFSLLLPSGQPRPAYFSLREMPKLP
jgi:polysaccharide biosynthesis protein PslG